MVKDRTPDSGRNSTKTQGRRKNSKRQAVKTGRSRAQVSDTAHVRPPRCKEANPVAGLLDVHVKDDAGELKRPWLTVWTDPRTRTIIHFDLRFEEEGDR